MSDNYIDAPLNEDGLPAPDNETADDALLLSKEQAAELNNQAHPKWLTERQIPEFLHADAEKAKELLPRLKELEKELVLTTNQSDRKALKEQIYELKQRMPRYWVDQEAFYQRDEKITGPVWISRRFHGYGPGDGWQLEINFYANETSKIVTIKVPHNLLASTNREILTSLTDKGLQLFNAPDLKSTDNAIRGWLSDGKAELISANVTSQAGLSNDQKYFLLPNLCIKASEEQPDLQLSCIGDENAVLKEVTIARGNLENYIGGVLKPAFSSDAEYFALSISLALTGVLTPILEVEAPVVHEYGESGSGKTSAAQIAASLWGYPGKSGESKHSFMLRGNSTINALEPKLAARKNTIAIIDEVTMASNALIKDIAYFLKGGKGKDRMTSTVQERRTFTWCEPILLNAEKSIQQLCADFDQTKQTGEIIRILELNFDADLRPLKNKSIDEAKQIVERMVAAAKENYALLGPAFVKWIVKTLHAKPNWEAELKERHKKIAAEFCYRLEKEGLKLDISHRRVIDDVAIIQLAAELLVDYFKKHDTDGKFVKDSNSTPIFNSLADSEIKNLLSASYAILRSWIGSNIILSPADRGLTILREFIARNENAFVDIDDAGNFKRENLPTQIYGYQDSGHYYLLESALANAIKGIDTRPALIKARQLGILKPEGKDKLIFRKRVNGVKASLYRISKTGFDQILSDTTSHIANELLDTANNIVALLDGQMQATEQWDNDNSDRKKATFDKMMTLISKATADDLDHTNQSLLRIWNAHHVNGDGEYIEKIKAAYNTRMAQVLHKAA